MNILLVDDEEMVRQMIAQQLGMAGHAVHSVGEADAAEALLAAHPDTDAVISDICMPGRSGVELARSVKAKSPETAVILMTGYAELDSAVGAIDAQVFAYLRKPFRMEELMAVVGRLNDHLQMQRERRDHQRRLEELVAQLEQSQQRYRSLEDGIPGAVLMTDADFVIQSAGAKSSAVLGRAPEELTGHSVDSLRESEHAAEFRTRVGELLARRAGCLQFDGRVLRADGTLLHTIEFVAARDNGSPLKRTEGLFWIILDGSASHRLRVQAEIARDYLETVRRSRSDGKRIVGESQAIRDVLRMIKNIAPTDAPVLVCGESGAGKGLVAESIHINSDRSEKPFVVANCAALPAEQLDRELFGYRRGAFVGAGRDKRGLVEIADGGTLLIDEIGEMAPPLQAKLLTLLETGEFYRLGSGEARRINVRVLASTHRNLAREVEEGRFREDLLKRLAVIRINLPPLRERVVDIPLIAQHLLTHSSITVDHPKRLIRDALESLMRYDWPGNVRELRNVLERAVILAGEGNEIAVQHLSITPKEQRVEISPLKELEANEIQKAMAFTEGNKTRAAKMLGITRQTLISRLKRLPSSQQDPQ